MSQQACTIHKCSRTSRALCHCCNQNICLLHLKEHYDRYISQLTPLTDEINTLENRLIGIDRKILMEKSRQELEAWREQCYQTIDRFFQEKYQELEQIFIDKIHQQNQDISFIRKTLTKLIEEQEASQNEIDLLKIKIHQLNENLDYLEHLSIQITTQPLILDHQTIEINADKHLSSILSLPFKTIDCPEIKSSILACNNQVLLFHQHYYLCLVDYHFKIIKKLPWNSGQIRDVCWSPTLDRFILTTESCGICFVQENSISFENIKNHKNETFHSCTSSDTSLFVTMDTYGSSIIEYHLSPSIKLVKQWKSPDTCTREEFISNIRYHNAKLGLIIQKFPEKIVNLELRSIDTLNRLWSIEIDMGLKPYQYGYCLLNNHDWLFINKNSSSILHISKDGKIKGSCIYNSKPCNATLFGRNILAILTDKGINFHKL